MRSIPLLLTLLAPPAAAAIPTHIDAFHLGVPQICHHVALELKAAEAAGTIAKETALQVFDNCLLTQEA